MEETIVERIRKLLALAADKANPHESEAAAAMANRLMLKHSISKEKVDSAVSGDDLRNYGHAVHTTGKFASWEVQLLGHIATANLCKLVKVGRDSFDVIGHNDNVEVTIMMQGWLRGEIHRLAQESYARKDEHSHWGAMDPHRFHTSFKHGAVAAVGSRIMKEKAETVKAFNPGEVSSLAVIASKVDQQITKIYGNRLTKGKPSRAGENASGNAYGAGHAAGSKVALKPSKMLGGGK